MTDAVRVLHVDDDPDQVELVATFLEGRDERLAVETATSPREGLDRLDEETFDCVVSDFEMPGMDGIEFLEAVRRDHPDLPFVLYTGKGSEEVASEAISAGVTDYLQKETGTGQYAVLANRIRNVVDQYRARHAADTTEEKLTQLAENTSNVLLMFDGDWSELLFVNSAYEELWGGSIAELEADPTSFLEYVHPEDRAMVERSMAKLSEGTPDELEYRVITDEGEQLWVLAESKPLFDEDGTVDHIVWFVRDITGRAEQMRRLETLISNLPGIVYRCRNRRDWPMEFLRGECESLTGYPPEAIRDGDVTWGEDVVHPADRDRVWNSIQGTLDDEAFEITYRIRTRDGATKWVWERGRAVDAPATEETVLEGFVTEITDRKEHEQRLEEVNALLSTLVETLPVGILVEDDSRDVMAVNQQLFDLFDVPRSPEEVFGTDCERMAEEVSEQFVDSGAFVERIDDVIAAGVPVGEEELQREDGRVFERSYRPLDLPGGSGHLWVYRDVTERTEQERTLLMMTRRLEALNRATRDLLAAETREEVAEIGVEMAEEILELDANAIHLYDEDRSVLVPAAATDAVYDLIGEPPAFSPGDSIAWRTYERGEALALDNVHDDGDVHNRDSPIHSELQIPIADEGVLLAGSPTPAAFDQQDVLLGEILAGNIATALEHVEWTEQLRARERELTRQNDRLEEFASVVSHDLRNPLNVATGLLEMVRDECDSEHLDGIERAHDRMEGLIDDVLTLAREDRRVTDSAPVALGEFTRNCWQNVETAEATLVTDVERTIRADESRLKQLFENLVRNAVEHGGDDVTVTVGELDDGFYVEDDGPGIPPDRRDRVFQTGYSTLDGGTGFGLSIVRQVVEEHGWDVDVTEGTDGGARIAVTGVEFAAE